MDTDARWRFFHDGEWRWHRLGGAGRIVAECEAGFASLQACWLDASRFGYPLGEAGATGATGARLAHPTIKPERRQAEA